jgi:hypothetical protein
MDILTGPYFPALVIMTHQIKREKGSPVLNMEVHVLENCNLI